MKSFKFYVFCSLLFSVFIASASASIERRQLPLPPGSTATNTDKQTTTTSTSTTDRSTTASSTTTTTSTTSDTSKSTTSTSATPSVTPTPHPPGSTSAAAVSLTSISGSEVIITLTGTAAPSSSAPASSQAPSSPDSGLGTGSIIGLSVAGGVAILGVIGFFIWKFTRKHNSDFDDNEAIKWPDLNNHGTGNTDSHPLPVKNTGRAGFDTGSEADLSLSHNYSTPDFNPNAGVDPYAVPPLPHLNPNQPYRDEATSITGYYDPYRGPVPGSIEQDAPGPSEWGSEAIPMTQMNTGTGRMSPAPQMAYGAAAYDTTGRQSPGPYAAYAAPGVAGQPLGGRISPGPQLAYHTGAMSP